MIKRNKNSQSKQPQTLFIEDLGKVSGGGMFTTLAIGEEGDVTTFAIGEEDDATTLAIGEEDPCGW